MAAWYILLGAGGSLRCIPKCGKSLKKHMHYRPSKRYMHRTFSADKSCQDTVVVYTVCSCSLSQAPNCETSEPEKMQFPTPSYPTRRPPDNMQQAKSAENSDNAEAQVRAGSDRRTTMNAKRTKSAKRSRTGDRAKKAIGCLLWFVLWRCVSGTRLSP